ncbi:hypothetical protein Pka01_38230 [Planotetraspora kaengkrachanensis]|uniref:Uncharacterized protein n=1 Tax=Planotetraspora kaengkrachanensis TaxID=575193 RepID=A0A8J3PTQ0_9ACTN|nr:hypothetical protein Pka01_38230 [Planotetraspora kaengkrachanensis]
MSAADVMGVLSTGWEVTADPFLAVPKQNDIRFYPATDHPDSGDLSKIPGMITPSPSLA